MWVEQNASGEKIEDIVYQGLVREAHDLLHQVQQAISLHRALLEQSQSIFSFKAPNNSERETVESRKREESRVLKEERQDEDERSHRHFLIKNDSKNIPKNFGTAIALHIKKSISKVKELLDGTGISVPEFLNFTKKVKEELNSLFDLRDIWSPSPDDPEKQLKDCFRIMSFDFMRKHSLSYIFNSRIKNTYSHIKYGRKILEGLKEPAKLTNLKDY